MYVALACSVDAFSVRFAVHFVNSASLWLRYLGTNATYIHLVWIEIYMDCIAGSAASPCELNKYDYSKPSVQIFRWNIFEFEFFHTGNRNLFCPRTRKPDLIWKTAPFSRKTLSKCLKCRESCSCVITLGLFYIDHYIGFVGFLYQSIGRSTRSISNLCLLSNTITLPFGSLLRKIRRLIALMVKIAQFDHG